jgi:aminoglycoside/choline kinase family phosphotransferase
VAITRAARMQGNVDAPTLARLAMQERFRRRHLMDPAAPHVPPAAPPPSDPAERDPRLALLTRWVAKVLGTHAFAIAPASSDASFRRYFRVTPAHPWQGHATVIAMDAPPPMEDCRPFVHVAGLLAAAGVHAPHVLAQDLDRGLLLLTDLGTRTYLAALDARSARALYQDALDALVRWQCATRAGTLPPYDRALLARELALFPDWYVARHLGRTLTVAQRRTVDDAFRLVLDNNLAQPQVYVHRDYHSRNLMVSTPNPGVLDFQDAVIGPITYDLVSLLRDAYIAWDEAEQIDYAVRYWERARAAQLPVDPDFATFWRDFEWMGVQRQLKVLGIFARLCHRDGKAAYLGDMPRVLSYLRGACARYGALAPLLRLLDELEGVAPRVVYTF